MAGRDKMQTDQFIDHIMGGVKQTEYIESIELTDTFPNYDDLTYKTDNNTDLFNNFNRAMNGGYNTDRLTESLDALFSKSGGRYLDDSDDDEEGDEYNDIINGNMSTDDYNDDSDNTENVLKDTWDSESYGGYYMNGGKPKSNKQPSAGFLIFGKLVKYARESGKYSDYSMTEISSIVKIAYDKAKLTNPNKVEDTAMNTLKNDSTKLIEEYKKSPKKDKKKKSKK